MNKTNSLKDNALYNDTSCDINDLSYKHYSIKPCAQQNGNRIIDNNCEYTGGMGNIDNDNRYNALQYRAHEKAPIENFIENRHFGIPRYTGNRGYKKAKFMKNRKEQATMNVPSVINIDKYIDQAKNAAIDYSINYLKNKLGITLKLHLYFDQYKRFLIWLRKYDKNFKHHVIKYDNKHYTLGDVDFIVNFGNQTFARIQTGSAIKRTYTDYDIFSGEVHASVNDIHMYIFGKNSFAISKKVKEFQNTVELLSYKVSVSKASRYDDEHVMKIYYESLTKRMKDSVFLNDHIKEEIFDHINKFFKNKVIYDKRNLRYKTGILLHGEPGTGKSTLGNMIASEFNTDLVVINMSEFVHLDVDRLVDMLNADDKTYVLLLEDIDCVIGNRESEQDDLENKKNVNKLLQFLDSASSPSNVIFVATTNHIEKLDKAILRDGRFDLIKEISDITKTVAIDMCTSFGLDKETSKSIISKNMVNDRINPAKLQNLILAEIDKY